MREGTTSIVLFFQRINQPPTNQTNLIEDSDSPQLDQQAALHQRVLVLLMGEVVRICSIKRKQAVELWATVQEVFYLSIVLLLLQGYARTCGQDSVEGGGQGVLQQGPHKGSLERVVPVAPAPAQSRAA